MTQAALQSGTAVPEGYAQRLADTRATLARIADMFPQAALASSLAAEDMVLTDLILRAALPVSIFSLDTGRLPQETLDMVGKIERHYGYRITMVQPDPQQVDAWVAQHGADAFYDSVELRKSCCHLRKVEPLARALQGKQAWITGQRRAQAATRGALQVQEHDTAHGMEKFNPLADWSEQDVWHYLRSHQVPYNALHDAGYPSIGCAPCTRAVQSGEDIRAGRWWWETPESKECGLHVVDGKLVRIKKSP